MPGSLLAGMPLLLATHARAESIPGYACQEKADYLFCDTSQDLDKRVDDLVNRLDLNRLGAQLTARESPAYPELGLPDFYWGTNALHSIREYQCADGRCPTAFPIPPSYGATWNMSLARDMAQAFGYELRAAYNKNVSFSDHDGLTHRPGLTAWSPTINIVRDPRWGRNVEVPSEDPLLTADYAKAYTEGVQKGPSERYPMTAVTLKHWLAYSVEKYGDVDRHTYDAEVSAYDLASTYMVPFEPAIRESKAMGLMCSYNMVNGKPTCGNPELTKVLREDWGFDGYISSDTDACGDIWSKHNYSKDAEHAVGVCLAGGTDINSGDTYKSHLANAVNTSATTKEAVLEAARNAFKIRFRLGLFDPKEKDENRDIPWDVVGSEKHKQSSMLAARQSMTLLRNDGILPFSAKRSLAVIGTDADDLSHTIGNYNADNLCPHSDADDSINTDCLNSIWDELRNRTSAAGAKAELVTAKTGGWNSTLISQAVEAAMSADQVLLFVSNFDTEGAEAQDVTTIELEKSQRAMLQAVLKVRKDVALVMINGAIIGWDSDLAEVPAVLEAWQPGAFGAAAVAETVMGEYNPGGKLPVTLYYSNYTDESDFLNMSMTHGPGRTYRYIDPAFPVAYPFGHGLSYTSFDFKADAKQLVFSKESDVASVKVTVTNTGNLAGDEVLQLYVKPQRPSTLDAAAPLVQKQLIAYERLGLQAGESKELSFKIKATSLGLAGSNGDVHLHAGNFTLIISRGHGDTQEVRMKVNVAAPVLLKRFRKFWDDAAEILV